MAGPGRASHSTSPWLSGRHELRKGQVCWGFLTGPTESASSLHSPCPPPSPASGTDPGLYCCPWQAGWLVSSLGSPPHTHLPEASSGVDGGCGWTLGSGKRIRAAAAALGRALGWRKTGLRDLTGGCSEAKPEEWPLKRGLTLSLGRNQPRLGSEPSSEMGALPLPIPGGQGHGVKGPQIQSWFAYTPSPAPTSAVTLGRQLPPWASVVTVPTLRVRLGLSWGTKATR